MDHSKLDQTNNQSAQHCAFCERSKQEVNTLIAGPAVCICNECVQACLKVLEDAEMQKATATEKTYYLPPPKEIHAVFNEYVVGQELAKRTLAVAAYNHYKRIELLQKGRFHPLNIKDDTELSKSNVLLIGPTGSGKTLLAKALAKVLNLPFAIVDATTLTEAGYVGEDVENILQRLLQAADGDIERTQRGIIYLDEIDKLSRRGDNPSITRDVSGEGVQQCLLKLLEGTVASVPLQGSRKHPNQETALIDTTNILFICGGTFAGLEKLIYERTERIGIGFSADVRRKAEQKPILELLNRLETEDLVKYGLIPELIGRLPIIVGLEELNEMHLIKILKEPKNALVKQYVKLFKANRVQLTFREEALRTVAKLALTRKTGARGLRAILENTLRDLMYDLPSTSNVTQVIINDTYIQGKSPPTFVYKKEEKRINNPVTSRN
jgi:ATP-dependent Clp protease ATP-binding subunit ClpX